MKIYLSDQQADFPKHLNSLKKHGVTPYNTSELKEVKSEIRIKTSIPFHEIDFSFFFNYHIFPPHIMTFITEWEFEKRKIRAGDTIVQQVYIPPIKMLSQKIIFGVRVKEVTDEKFRKGFSYETLTGHVEKGISSFIIEASSNSIQFQIHTFSSPNTLISKLFAPVFSLPYQKFCTNAALNNVKRQIENQKFA